MSTTATRKDSKQDTQLLQRILDEGYGPGAWHGADFKAALADVDGKGAFWRPAPERHNIAEIALHHAYCVRSVRGQLSGESPGPFVLEGEDWFAVANGSKLSWTQIRAVVETEQDKLVAAVNAAKSALTSEETFKLVLGITGHAIYHAGQVQLLKRLHDG
ncbi:MAG: DinB family protein [Longimicrobiales bacterium]